MMVGNFGRIMKEQEEVTAKPFTHFGQNEHFYSSLPDIFSQIGLGEAQDI